MYGNEHGHVLLVGMQTGTSLWWGNLEIWIESLRKNDEVTKYR